MRAEPLLARALAVGAALLLGIGAVAYLLSDTYHALIGTGPWADALAALLVALLALLGQRLLSLVFYRDLMLGESKVARASEERIGTLSALASEVGGELRQVRDFNAVVSGHLRDVISGTEKAAYSLVERLQTIDTVVNELDRFVSDTSAQSARLVSDSAARMERNQAIVAQMASYVKQRGDEAIADQQRMVGAVEQARALESLVQLIKHWQVPIDARGDLAHAVITSGGVSVREVDPKTMQSKKALGLYFAGEVLDVDAYTGGYNLQIAFCTAQSFANNL